MVRRIITAILLALVVAPSARADYLAGWRAAEFYQEVLLCRQAIVYPGVKEYVDKGLAAGSSAETMRSQVITVLPLLDSSASAACFCAVNRIAKASTYADYAGLGNVTERLKALKASMDVPECVGKLEESMRALQKEGAANSLRLR